MTEKEILDILDNSNDGYYCQFVSLNHGYSYLVDTRLNIFRADENWAVVIERLGFNPRADSIILEINYYGNCLTNLEEYNNRTTNYYNINPMGWDNFIESIDFEYLKPNTEFWIVRGNKVKISHNKQDYSNAGIKLNEYESNQIGVEEAARLLILEHRNLFRATEEELYKSLPKSLKKILVIDEWYHKDFTLQIRPKLSEEHLRQTYEVNRSIGGYYATISYETFAIQHREDESRNDEWNKKEWENNRPSSYETWQQIAKVIATNDPKHYKPTLKPNTHWSNWPESGSL